MTSPLTMSCEHCRELLTDLVCGELDKDREASVRAHATQCPRCGPELTRFSRVVQVAASIPLDEPPPSVALKVMQAARETLAQRSSSAATNDSVAPTRGFKAWLARLGAWAMSPQIAMASVLVLVVGIGLYALPFGKDATAPASLQLAREPEPEAAPAASATATGIQTPEEEAAPPAAESTPTAERERKMRRAETSARARTAGSTERSAQSIEGLGALSKGAGKGSASYETPVAGREGKAESRPSGARARKAATPAVARESSSAAEFAAPPPASTPAPRPANAADTAESTASAPAPSPALRAQDEVAASEGAGGQPKNDASWAQAAYSQGIAAAERGEHAQAVSLLEPVVNQGPKGLRSPARLRLARSLRAQGDCVRALAYYRPLVQSQSASRAVLEEAADCYERTGNTAQARALRAGRTAPDSKSGSAAPATAEPAGP